MIVKGAFSHLNYRYNKASFKYGYWRLEHNIKRITKLQRFLLKFIPMQERKEKGFILKYKTFRGRIYVLGFKELEKLA